jgi:hypothetical protein
MQRERKLERDDETLATVSCVLGIASACVSSVGRMEGKRREEGKGNKGPNLGPKFGGAQEEKERDRDRALQFGRRSWFFFSLSINCPVCPRLPWTALDCPTMETRRESPFFFFF